YLYPAGDLRSILLSERSTFPDIPESVEPVIASVLDLQDTERVEEFLKPHSVSDKGAFYAVDGTIINDLFKHLTESRNKRIEKKKRRVEDTEDIEYSDGILDDEWGA